MKIGEIGNQLT